MASNSVLHDPFGELLVAQTANAPQPGFVNVEGESLGEPEPAEKRVLTKKAEAKHLRRTVGKVVGSVFMGLGFLLLPRLLQETIDPVHLISQLPLISDLSSGYRNVVGHVIHRAPVIVLGGFLTAILSWYLFYQNIWYTYFGRATSRVTGTMIEAYTRIFRTYSKAKRFAITGYIVGVWGLFVFSLIVYDYKLFRTAFEKYQVTSIPDQLILIPILSFIILVLSCLHDTRFLPGRIFLNELMVINERSNHSFGIPANAVDGLHALAREYKNQKSWWFY